MKTLIKLIGKISLIISASLMSMMLILVILNVIGRYFLQSSIIWSVEISDYTMIWSVFFASVSLLCFDEHLSITALADALPGIPQKLLKSVIYLLSLIFGVFLFYSSSQFVAQTGNQFSTTIRWLPMSYVYVVIPVASALIVLVSLLKLIITFKEMAEIGESRS